MKLWSFDSADDLVEAFAGLIQGRHPVEPHLFPLTLDELQGFEGWFIFGCVDHIRVSASGVLIDCPYGDGFDLQDLFGVAAGCALDLRIEESKAWALKVESERARLSEEG